VEGLRHIVLDLRPAKLYENDAVAMIIYED